MIATMMGALYLTESTDNESMLYGVVVMESVVTVSSVFVIHPFL